MQIFHDIADLSQVTEPLHLAIGVFDGVHQGHAAVIQSAKDGAAQSGGVPMLVTFDPHPIRILRPDEAPRILTHIAHKLRKVEALGLKHALVIPFDEAFSRQTGPEFIRQLLATTPDLRQICVGRDWKFGFKRSGDFELLRNLGLEFGFAATGVETFVKNGTPVSSTEIRKLIRKGRLDEASNLLGSPYSVLGSVVKGDQLGRTLGFPTANLLVHSEQLPPSGVYAVDVRLKNSGFSGVANLGVRPTLAQKSEQRRLEVHILDYSGEEFYGEELEITFRGYLRPEQKFSDLEELSAQIQRDVAKAREVLDAG